MQPTLFEFAGGSDALLALATAHHARCLEDPELNHPFSHEDQHPEHVQRLAMYWGEVLGGPSDFSQSCSDQTSVLRMHAGNGDISDLGRRFHACFVQAMDDADLPSDAAFRQAMSDYMTWAVDEMLSFPDTGDDVPSDASMPRWTWAGLAADGSD